MNKAPHPEYNILPAVGYIMLATLLLATMDAIVKYMLEFYSTPQIVWVRYVGQVIWVCLILLIRQCITKERLKTVIKSNHLKLQIIRSLCMFGGTFTLFMGLSHVPLSLGAAIAELAPVFVTVLAALILKEHVGIYRWSMVALGLFGGLLIMKPFGQEFNVWLLFPVGTALCFSGYYIATRYLGAQDSTWTTLFYTALLGAFLSTCILALGDFWKQPSLEDTAIFLVLSLFGALGHLFLIIGFTRAPASVIAPFTYMGLVWAGLLGIIFFTERPDILSYAGAVCIVISGLVILHRERKASIKNRAIIRKGIR